MIKPDMINRILGDLEPGKVLGWIPSLGHNNGDTNSLEVLALNGGDGLDGP